MISSILATYGLRHEDCVLETLSTGLINATWKVIQGEQHFILQRVNDTVFKKPYQLAENIDRLNQYLKKVSPGYLFVAPIKNIHNDDLVHDPNHGYFRLFPFIKGSHTISVVITPGQAFEAAVQFGKFTSLLSEFEAASLHYTIPDFHNLTLRYHQFEEALKNGNTDRIKQSKELIEDIKSHYPIVSTFEGIRRNEKIPIRVTHNDTKISNVLFNDENKGICVIDLDTVMPGYFFSDLGDMMRTYLSSANEEEKDFAKIEVRDEFFRAIIQGYLSGMGSSLTREEEKLIFFSGQFMIYMQAIRFLVDYLNNDSYYSTQYEEHNFIRAGNQLCLLKQLEKKKDDFQVIISNELKNLTP
jgi:thiamine kinase-like enzyme